MDTDESTGYADLDRFWMQYDSEGSLDLSDLSALLCEVRILRDLVRKGQR